MNTSGKKYVVLLADGMADRPVAELGDKTPLAAARTPNMDSAASRGRYGMANTSCNNLPPGSDVMNMNIMGYDPEKYYTGRAPIEAASMGLNLAPDDVAFRMNTVTLIREEGVTRMDDYSAGHISSNESHELVKVVQKVLGNDEFSFYPGKGYRHLMVWKGGPTDVDLAPPHDIMGENVAKYLPKDKRLLKLYEKANELIADHPINRIRKSNDKKPANAVWFWGQGKKPAMPLFKDRWGLTGAVVSAVDLVQGLGKIAGLDAPIVPGATGYLDTNYAGKVDAALKALDVGDFVFLHVEAPDEAGHNGDVKAKVQAIEDFDAQIVWPMLKGLAKFKDWRVLIIPDHATPVGIRTHSKDPVPYILLSSEDSVSEKEIKFREILPEEKPEKNANYIGRASDLNRLFFERE